MPERRAQNGAHVVKMEPLAPGEAWTVAKLGKRVEQLHECLEAQAKALKEQGHELKTQGRALGRIEGALDVLRGAFKLPAETKEDEPPPSPSLRFPKLSWQVGVGIVAAMSGIQIVLKALDPLLSAMGSALPHVWKALIGA